MTDPSSTAESQDHQTKPRGLALHYRILIAMVGGAVLGLLLNRGAVPVDDPVTLNVVTENGQRTLTETAVGPDGVTEVLFSQSFPLSNESDGFARSYPKLAEQLDENGTLTLGVDNKSARIVHSVGTVTLNWKRDHAGVPAVTDISAGDAEELPAFWRRLALQNRSPVRDGIVVAAKAVGELFLRLLKMVTVPLILTSLVTGVTGLGGHSRFGRMFSGTMAYYISTSLIAICTGLILVNLIGPGIGAVLPGGGRVIAQATGGVTDIVYQQLERLLPTNPIAAVAQGEFLSIISFALILGVFINAVGGDHGRRLREFFESAFEVMIRMTGWVIQLAPYGVAAFMLFATATQGLEIFRTLAWYMATVFAALVVHAVIVLPLILKFVARRSPLEYFRALSPSLLTAFSTASSNAALPLTITCCETRGGVSNRVTSFVLPLGATINMDGTALYEVVAVLFIAQATPGVDLTVAQQILVAFTALLASVGAAGIPHAGLVMMAIVLQAVGLPLESQGVIIAVDRVLDMCRTTVNVWSDACGCAVVSRLTGETAHPETTDD